MSGRLVALYKVSSLGTAQLLASADSVAEFVQRRKALGQILAQDERAREVLHGPAGRTRGAAGVPGAAAGREAHAGRRAMSGSSPPPAGRK
ncbi:MAG: hypothetical protein MZV70_15075 [Desulfobacterales bacterium]|nr:hypothetical protein [Desulfobacterales bacterium]